MEQGSNERVVNSDLTENQEGEAVEETGLHVLVRFACNLEIQRFQRSCRFVIKGQHLSINDRDVAHRKIVNWPGNEVWFEHFTNLIGPWVDHAQNLNRNRSHTSQDKEHDANEHRSLRVSLKEECH